MKNRKAGRPPGKVKSQTFSIRVKKKASLEDILELIIRETDPPGLLFQIARYTGNVISIESKMGKSKENKASHTEISMTIIGDRDD